MDSAWGVAVVGSSPYPLSRVLTAPPCARLSLSIHAAQGPLPASGGASPCPTLPVSHPGRHSGGAAGPALTPASHTMRCEGRALPLLPLVPMAPLASAILAVRPEPSDVHQARCHPSASRVPSSWGWWGSQKVPRMKSGGWAHLTLRASAPAPTSVLWADQHSPADQLPKAGVTP